MSTGQSFTQEDGHQLAADMMREIHDHWRAREEGVVDDAELAMLWRRDNGAIVKLYFETVGARGSEDLARGFYAVLTDFIGCCVDGSVVPPEFYEKEPTSS